MSGYFDGLMRSSGLPLGDAPVLGQAPRGTAPLEEIDVATPAAAPLVGPLELAARTVGPPTAPAPSTASATIPLITGEPVASPADLPRPVASRETSASAPPSAEPTVTHQRIIQAAMRWIADGSVQPQPGPDTVAAMSESVLRVEPAAEAGPHAVLSPAFPTAMSPGEAGEPSVIGTVEGQPIEQAPARRAAAELLPLSMATQATRATPRTGLPAHDDVHVSIGAIHLRVEAPAPPALQAVTPAPAHKAASPPATTRTGLSRRALRRI